MRRSQCTYRCVVLPDPVTGNELVTQPASQCTYRCVVLPDAMFNLYRIGVEKSLNAPTGAWCSLTPRRHRRLRRPLDVSMHLQVRGAP